jgi:hypothetical protein
MGVVASKYDLIELGYERGEPALVWIEDALIVQSICFPTVLSGRFALLKRRLLFRFPAER